MLDLITLSIFDANEFFNWFVNHANYWFVFIFMVIESSFIPFPSELVVPPAAYLAMQPDSTMNIYAVTLIATAGALVGALVNYYLALWVGRPIVYRFANSRLGHMLLIDEAKVDKAEKYFDDHGAISTFIGRLIPAVRQLISIPAGLARMHLGKFVIFTTLGALVWNAILALLGYFLSTFVNKDQLLTKVEEYNDYLTYAGYGIGVICVLFILYNAFKPKPSNNTI
ncbi:MAG TPA: DedA family protein [Muribaculum sp.]|jgi:membrane protein DedA with SNARE-associated domain|uniref:DedA family protein n=1 Tax=Heminiphilus faecis TaxID=2601703 RepID=A0ABV4CUA2_9BACT|nr:DedA family protein [Heminiphilus faecis]RLT76665.1 DedA family protein [bacterium J10(2018)]HRF67599.1 DedA family protein [Muribaculum sp.]